jgi:periplasmic protein TonB
MATRAFLLCGDEKAVQAVTQILDELEVSFEHSSEPAFSLKRLATQRFDLLIVDCDNVQNATQVFNSARASSLNKASIAIAIVEGKAGVPNAFRLGASLVLTKPVALEQVRNTLRTGIGMTKKEAQEVKAPAPTVPTVVAPTAVTSSTPSPAVTPPVSPATLVPTTAAPTPAANRPAASPAVLTPVAPKQPASTPTPVRPVAPVAETPKPTTSVPPAPAKPVVAVTPATPPAVSTEQKKPAVGTVNEPKGEPTLGSPALAKASAASGGANSASARNFDAVFATPSTPEKSEKAKGDFKSDPTKLTAEEPKHAGTSVLSIVDPLAEEDALDPVKDHGVPSFGALGAQSFAGIESQKSGGKGVWIAALVLVLLAGGGYGAWLTQPGFRKMIEWEYLNVMSKIGTAHAQPQTAPAVKPPTPVSAPAAASAPSDGQAADAGTTGNESQTVATNATSAAPSSTPSSQASSTPPDTATKTAAALQAAKQDTTPNHANPSLVAASASVPPTAASKPSSDLLEVPEDYADDQVVHRVHPSYPKQARARKLHGAVVLQAIINKQGKVDSLQLVSGDPLLAQAAADAVKQWRYKPYWHNGEASDFQTRITVDFKQP